MHFHIIEISDVKVRKGKGITESDIYEDGLVLQETDYAGEQITGLELAMAMESIKKQLSPYATVNLNRRTIRFRKHHIVLRRWKKEVNAIVREFREECDKGKFSMAEYHLRSGICELSSGDLFYYMDHTKKFASIVADYLAGYLPSVLHIGNILDAHS